jgi:hypothetical protein
MVIIISHSNVWKYPTNKVDELTWLHATERSSKVVCLENEPTTYGHVPRINFLPQAQLR